jgi:hypothetical protein
MNVYELVMMCLSGILSGRLSEGGSLIALCFVVPGLFLRHGHSNLPRDAGDLSGGWWSAAAIAAAQPSY